MKKINLVFGILLLFCFILSGCSSQGNETITALLPESIEKVEIAFYSLGETQEWEMKQDEITSWKLWTEGLTTEHITFEEGNSPADKDGGESYHFNINHGEVEFSYVSSGKDGYVVFKNEWYQVSNPTNPPIEISKKELQDIIPMVMIEGKLYYDTGKESTINMRCGVMDGEITSTVDSSLIPEKDNQSNFGSGYGYQYGIDNTIEIFMNEKWIVFELRDENGNTI